MKGLTSASTNRSKVPFIEGKNVRDVVAVSQHDDRGVGQAERDIRVPLDNGERCADVVAIERLELVCARGDLLEEGYLRLRPDSRGQEIVELSQHEGRQQERRLSGLKCSGGCLMVALA